MSMRAARTCLLLLVGGTTCADGANPAKATWRFDAHKAVGTLAELRALPARLFIRELVGGAPAS